MSVTFSPDLSAVPYTFGVSCYASEDRAVVGAVATYEEALTVRSVHMAECESCAYYGCFTTTTPVGHGDAPEVNVSNRNALDLLRALGVPVDPETGEGMVGRLSAEEMGARAILAQAADDEALPTISYRAGSPDRLGATMVDCGREAGYLAHRLGQIAEVVEYARTWGVGVTWG